MNRFDMTQLIQVTLKHENEYDRLRQADLSTFLAAISYLEIVGLSQTQLQMLIGRPFSLFGEDQCLETIVMALAIERGTATVDQWHEDLRNEAIWARMHGMTLWVPTETLPDMNEIDIALGLPCRHALTLLDVSGSLVEVS